MMFRSSLLVVLTALAGAALPSAGAPEAGPGPNGAAGYLWNPVRRTADNHPLRIKVLVLNYDPKVPSEGGKKLSEVFRWNDSRRLAGRYEQDLEYASGGALELEVVEWRDLDEIYAQKDGFRYTIEEYVRNRRAGKGWRENLEAGYPQILREQGVPDLIDAGKIDEVWIFSDHFFGLWEASMAGPGAFFINGGVYPEIKTVRPFAFYGFNYERGVAEMLHNTSHRTEATMNRIYGEWKLQAPKNNWELFSANDRQSNGVAGVGTCHWPANAEKDYDYGNPRTVQSHGEDFLRYPKLTGENKPVSRTTWGRGERPDYHSDYMRWYFGLLPRAPGWNADGRANNWWKYLYNFPAYDGKGRELPPAARLLPAGSGEPQTLRVAYHGPVPLDPASLGGDDLELTLASGRSVSAKLVGASDSKPAQYLVGTYSFTLPRAPGVRIRLRAGKVRDANGKGLAGADLGGMN